jgi:hypothetical protein
MRCRAIAVALLIVGCGGGSAAPPGSGGASCMTRAACGGAVVGTWTIASQCVDVALGATCAGAKLDPVGLTTTGMVTYKGDLTYVLTTQTKGTQKLSFPKACLTSAGMTSSCAEVGSSLTDGLYSGVVGTVCTNLTSDCECSLDVDTDPATESGTYAVNGTVITHTPTNGAPYDSGFCVNGTELDEAPMRGNTSGLTVFTRQ